MAQTRMFRDRVVSMEQTFEGGEKHLELLKALCLEAMPEFEYTTHRLDHERDMFLMDMKSPDGRRKTIAWTRMVLFDAERIPAIAADPGGAVRGQIVSFLKARALRPEITVTFRHLEEGWVDTPEPRPSRRRGRRGGRGGRGSGGQPQPQSQKPQQGRGQPGQPGRPGERPRGDRAPAAAAQGQGGQGGRPTGPRPPEGGSPGRSGRRRRSRRRRRGGGGGGGGGGAAPGPPGPGREGPR